MKKKKGTSPFFSKSKIKSYHVGSLGTAQDKRKFGEMK